LAIDSTPSERTAEAVGLSVNRTAKVGKGREDDPTTQS
jgi:hypothetical protein